MNGIFIIHTIRFITVTPIINGSSGVVHKNAIHTNITLSIAIEGIDEKTFLIHKYLFFVIFLNRENIYASKFSLIKNAVQLAIIILGVNHNIFSNISWSPRNGAAGNCIHNRTNKATATCAINAIKIILWVSFLPNLSFTMSVKRNVTENINVAAGAKKVLNHRLNEAILYDKILLIIINHA